jgi:hypothetical protein
MSDDNILMCTESSLESPFDDNLKGPCKKCGVEIQWRPHADHFAIKMCMLCALSEAEASASKGEKVGMAITPQTWEDVQPFLKGHTKH